MIDMEKLQKAISATITAGYQLNSEAFEFLTQLTSSDPAELIETAIQQMDKLEEKPFFIEKDFLESIIQKQALQTPTIQEEPELIQIQTNEPQTVTPTKEPPTQISEVEENEYFYPYAREVTSQLEIIEDPTSKLTSNGTINEYLAYFQDRFKRIEKILRQRMDVRAATPIAEALKSQPKTKMKIICMLTEKKESKQQVILSVEDLQSSATILIPKKAPPEVHKKAALLLPDQIICVAVIKTRTNLFMAEDIIFPEVGRKSQQRASEPIYAVLTSDIHIGSNKFQKESFKRFIKWLNGKYGTPAMREIAGRVKYLLVAGDIVDGVGVYPNQELELTVRDVHRQYAYAAKILKRIPSYIEVVLGPGNHDATRKALPQPAIPASYLEPMLDRPNIHPVGSPCFMSLHGVEVLMFHGRSLDDIVNTIPGMDHQHPEKSMRLLLQGRHLAPLYGGKTMLSPENRDYLVIDKVPDILMAGHIHVLGYCNYRGILVINSGGWQDQTDYMQKLGLMPTPGKVPVVNLQTLEVTVLSFTDENQSTEPN
jgi:DNA polymerase II small subunit